MICKNVVELVTDYLEGTLSAQDRRRFEEHLEHCDGCTEYLAQIRATRRIAAHLASVEVPDHIRRELMKAFRDFKRS